MSIGTRIYELRTAKNLSQGELADMLDVSRQSVSKWETDMAVPDLDKLIKICDVFEISLDELTGRETINKCEDSKNKTSTSAQKIIGYILFTFSLVVGVIVMLFGTNEADFIILLPIALAMFVCGLLCIFAGNKAFYWCIWTALAPITILTPHIVGLPLLSTLTLFMIAIIIVMFFVAKAVFRDTVVQVGKKKTVLLILAWVLPIALYILHICLVNVGILYASYSVITSITLNFICYILIALLETYTVCYIENLKKNK